MEVPVNGPSFGVTSVQKLTQQSQQQDVPIWLLAEVMLVPGALMSGLGRPSRVGP